MGHAFTILDQHRTPEETERQQQQHRDESASHEKTQAATVAAQRAYELACREWRGGRPEYKALIAAVRKESPDQELRPLAAAAGATANDVSEMRFARRRALGAQSKAANCGRDQRELAAVDAELAAAEKKRESAKTPLVQEEAENEIWVLQNRRQPIFLRAIESRMALESVEGAKASGLI